jgi:LAGLIDADG endonuclease
VDAVSLIKKTLNMENNKINPYNLGSAPSVRRLSYPQACLASSFDCIYFGRNLTHFGYSWYSVSRAEKKLDPYFVSGFSDAESSFVIRIFKNSKYKTGWKIEARFQIGLHKKDIALL